MNPDEDLWHSRRSPIYTLAPRRRLLPSHLLSSLSSVGVVSEGIVSCSLKMSGKYIMGTLAVTGVVAYVLDNLISDQKLFGGTTPKTVTGNDWGEETDKKFQAWPRTAGPPVVMNPITRQNFIIKSNE
ncbi:uncharacterized protein LOC116255052 isoform X1 [Nymphaea colorata]|nr:uncharacterized protein LOC116255052 isoform X1 [Nymphaea colorata]